MATRPALGNPLFEINIAGTTDRFRAALCALLLDLPMHPVHGLSATAL